MSIARDMFVVRDAADLDPDVHARIVVPTEGKNFFRMPIRAAEEPGAPPVAVVPGSRVAQTAAGLRRLLVKFPESYCHSVKEHDAEGERANLSLGFALFDQRAGPTPEQTRVLANIDAFAEWVRLTMYGCERIRTTLGLGAANMPEAKQRLMAEAMELCVAKPAADPTPLQTASGRRPCRYCYVKLVPPSPTVNDMFLTYFWAPNGSPLSLERVRRLQNFRVVPFVEFEDVFVSKALRSLQMKLRECIVFPPAERPSHRFSAAFPQRVCTRDAPDGAGEEPAEDGPADPTSAPPEEPVAAADAAADGSPPAKRARLPEDPAPADPPAADPPAADRAGSPEESEAEEEEDDDAP